MSSRNPWWVVLASVMGMVVGMLPARGAAFRQTDYAYSATLRTTGAGPVYAVSLPLEVYRSVTHADLTDICVVNASGEVVPFAVRKVEATPLPSPAPVRLRLFPILGTSKPSGEALRLRLQEGETAVYIERPRATGAPGRPSSYLVDARALQQPIAQLLIGWDSAAPDFSARLQIDASDDLEHWRSIGAGAQVVSLHYAGQEFVRNAVPIDATRASFLRLTWNSVQGGPVIDSVEAIPRAGDAPAKRLSFEVAGSATARHGEFDFDLGARLPVEQVNLLLPESNSVVRAEFLTPVPGTRQWRTIAESRIYDLALSESGNLVNRPLPIPLTTEQHWKVRIGEAGGGIGNGVPRLEVSWIPSEVVFLARGKRPFKLLYGNADAPSLALTPGAILNPTGSEDAAHDSLQPGSATLEAAQLLGGPARLTPAAPARDWKRGILWTVLLLGVGVLALMAWRLLRALGPP